MSTTRTDFEGRKLDIYVDGSKTYQFTIINAETGQPEDMTDNNIWSTGIVSILKPSSDVIGTVNIKFTDRENGIIDFTIEPPISNSVNAGNWIGHLEILNEDSFIIEQQNFNFSIISNVAK